MLMRIISFKNCNQIVTKNFWIQFEIKISLMQNHGFYASCFTIYSQNFNHSKPPWGLLNLLLGWITHK
jgi:hypothetical protein